MEAVKDDFSKLENKLKELEEETKKTKAVLAKKRKEAREKNAQEIGKYVQKNFNIKSVSDFEEIEFVTKKLSDVLEDLFFKLERSADDKVKFINKSEAQNEMNNFYSALEIFFGKDEK